jgi:Zn-dependent M28 family amino/carboxypeptidase
MPTRTRIRASVAAAIVLAVVVVLFAQDRLGAPRVSLDGPALDEIRGDEIAAHIKFLSDDLLEGRAPSTRGGRLAASYLATQLATLGYGPAGDKGTYFQDVAILESVVSPSFTLTAGKGTPFTYRQDVVAFTGRQEPRVRVDGELVFVGHGIVAPEYKWNDYAGIDMTGKVALVMVNDPPATADEPQLFGGRAMTYYGRWTYKYEEAARQGAVGAVLIHTPESATYPWQVVQSSWTGTLYSLPPSAGEPTLALKAWVSNDAATEIVRRAGKDLDSLRAASLKRGTAPQPLGISVSATIDQKVQQKISQNVIGVLPGTNPQEGIIFSAHYDHLGTAEPKPGEPADADRIYNGAIDNASGDAGTLEIAQAFARARTRPRRSVYVMFPTAEESGLLGSAWFAAHPALPASAWAANINIDGLNFAGPAQDIVLLGAERSSIGTVASELAARHQRVVGADPEPERGYFFRSDHFSLAKVGIPAVSIGEPVDFIGKEPGFAKRVHDEYNEKRYHQPSDEFQQDWNYAGAVQDMRLLAELGWRLANDPAMPTYNPNEQFARPRQ